MCCYQSPSTLRRTTVARHSSSQPASPSLSPRLSVRPPPPHTCVLRFAGSREWVTRMWVGGLSGYIERIGCIIPPLRNVFISILRVILESSTTNTWYTGPCGSCSFWDCFRDFGDGATVNGDGAAAAAADDDGCAANDGGCTDNAAVTTATAFDDNCTNSCGGDGEEVTIVIAVGCSCCEGGSAA